MNPYDASDVLPPKPDEPVESGPSLFGRPLPRWFVLCFFENFFEMIVLVALLYFVIRELADQIKEKIW